MAQAIGSFGKIENRLSPLQFGVRPEALIERQLEQIMVDTTVKAVAHPTGSHLIRRSLQNAPSCLKQLYNSTKPQSDSITAFLWLLLFAVPSAEWSRYVAVCHQHHGYRLGIVLSIRSGDTDAHLLQ
ncbi:hypothetical protein [Hoeflea alexandrii]|uniref:hypothetical protein n=1 Tax=Hoeflea alexandrii TaxID=288436 RepID=UPI0022AF4EFF|nr:hypothetical protein [Hoeflea alexandrii]MCZ4292200.1 hypothetical protein [Hoeflea alexandrii]